MLLLVFDPAKLNHHDNKYTDVQEEHDTEISDYSNIERGVIIDPTECVIGGVGVLVIISKPIVVWANDEDDGNHYNGNTYFRQKKN